MSKAPCGLMKLYQFMIHLSKKHLNLTVSLRVINEILAKVHVYNIVEAYTNGSSRVL